jgi:MFS transporter, FHS family, L-fucose permease
LLAIGGRFNDACRASMLSHAPARDEDVGRIVERQYLRAFILVTSLFFAWAFAASLNDVLIRQFQKALAISRAESSFIQLAFYIGYFCAAIPAGLLIRRVGYKPTIILGLSLYAGGAFLFYPAASLQRFGWFLAALYVIAFGLAFLETAANPYISILGNARTASARLNLAQSFYGLGAIFGPLIGGAFIFSGIEHSPGELSAMTRASLAAYRAAESAAVQLPYLVVGLGIALLAIAVAFTPFPKLQLEDRSATRGESLRRSMLSVLRARTLRYAVVAQFFYVGAQVTIWSFFIDFSKSLLPTLSERWTAFMLSGSLCLLMIGRFCGAFLQTKVRPERMLGCFGAVNVCLCLLAAAGTGWPAVAALWTTSFFMSIMFPTIFALGVRDLGERTELGASFLIMSIIGGAITPPLTGLLSEHMGGIHVAMVIPAGCFLMCTLFALIYPSIAPRDGRG